MKEVTNSLSELCKKIDEALSQDHILFDIEFGRSKFKFYYPTTRKDVRKLRLERKRLIKMLFGGGYLASDIFFFDTHIL